MTERYFPPSGFLRMLIDDEAPLEGSEYTDRNLRRLIEMTRDAEVANRDWATMLLAQQEIDTEEVRHALTAAANDENEYVRGEALLGLAQRDRMIALPLLQSELQRNFVTLQALEAAAAVADVSLVESLRAFAEPSGDERLDELALEALAACEKGA